MCYATLGRGEFDLHTALFTDERLCSAPVS